MKIVRRTNIRARTEMCHASSLLKCENDTFKIAWFGGSYEGEADCAIFLTDFVADEVGKICKIKITDEAHWNPVLFRIDKNTIFLFFKVGNVIAHWRTYYMVSHDNGQNFERPKILVAGDMGGRGPVKNKAIRLSNGRILAPASLEDGVWRAFTDISDDNGQSWQKSNEIYAELNSPANLSRENLNSTIAVSEQSFSGEGVIQPTLWEGNKLGEVHMLLRSTYGKIFKSDSFDSGETWSSAYPINLPNNNSGIDVVKGEDDKIYLAYNPVSDNWGMRAPLSIAVSEDVGKNFERKLDLTTEVGEFSYPAIIEENGFLHVSYTKNRKAIEVCEIKL